MKPICFNSFDETIFAMEILAVQWAIVRTDSPLPNTYKEDTN